MQAKQEGVIKFDPNCPLCWGQVSGIIACLMHKQTLSPDDNLFEWEQASDFCFTNVIDAGEHMRPRHTQVVEKIDASFFSGLCSWVYNNGLEWYLEEDGSLTPESFFAFAGHMINGAIGEQNLLKMAA